MYFSIYKQSRHERVYSECHLEDKTVRNKNRLIEEWLSVFLENVVRV